MTCGIGICGCADVDDLLSVLQQEADYPALHHLSAVTARPLGTSALANWLAQACEACTDAMQFTAAAVWLITWMSWMHLIIKTVR